MKLLATGGAGFIGPELVRLAVDGGHQVLDLDALTHAPCLDNHTIVERSPLYVFAPNDIRNHAALDPTFGAFAPDAVVHLAGESHVDRSIANPVEPIASNVRGTFTFLEASRAGWLFVGDRADAC